METQDRRRYPRRDLSRAISLVEGDKILTHGWTQNISQCGVYFVAPLSDRVPSGIPVKVRLGSHKQSRGSYILQTVTGEAIIVRLEDLPRRTGHKGIALEFCEQLAVE
ncbi:MAG: hypothetical protein AMS15_08700 [Planctomycetes bacterium DG_23]|nr:MAG: hypothetical protein AMS15_08700 [Planctomycetes bacterium DG_23]